MILSNYLVVEPLTVDVDGAITVVNKVGSFDGPIGCAAGIGDGIVHVRNQNSVIRHFDYFCCWDRFFIIAVAGVAVE